MADRENVKNTQKNAEEKPAPKKGGLGKLLPWLVPALTLVICAGAGFAISRFFGTRGAAAESAEIQDVDLPPLNAEDTEATWYYDLEAAVANLNEPNVTRYVRVTLTLELGNGMAEKDGIPYLDQRKPLLKNWLTLFMSNQTIEGIRGERNLRQVQTRIADMFNQGLFPNSKPCIKRVLFKELSIQ